MLESIGHNWTRLVAVNYSMRERKLIGDKVDEIFSGMVSTNACRAFFYLWMLSVSFKISNLYVYSPA